MNKYSISSLPVKINTTGNYDNDTCSIELPDQAVKAIEQGVLKIAIYQSPNNGRLIKNLEIKILSVQGNIKIYNGGCDNNIFFDESTSGNYDLTLGRNCQVTIGSKTTCGHVRVFCDNTKFTCGKDCMFSDGIVIQGVAQHGIVNLKSRRIVNDNYSEIVLGDHIWLGRNATLTGKINIGDGSIIGIGSVVTGNIPSKVIAAGVPAKIIKKDHTWSRSLIAKDSYAERYTDEHENQLSLLEAIKSLFFR